MLNSQKPIVIILIFWITIGCLFFYLEYKETSVMQGQNAELNILNYKSAKSSFILMRLMRFLQNRLIAVYECYFLIISISFLLQLQSTNLNSALDLVSAALCFSFIFCIIYYLRHIYLYINDTQNTINYILLRFGFMTDDLKFCKLQN